MTDWIPATLQQIKVDRKWTLKDFEDRTGIELKQISGYCTGARTPSIPRLFQLTDGLGMTVDEFRHYLKNRSLYLPTPLCTTRSKKTTQTGDPTCLTR